MVFGHPIRHSASPAMHNAAMQALGINWRYLAFDVPPRSLAAALEGARAMGFVGLNLTVPHKLPAFEWVDEVDESARQWRAVNTITFLGRSPSGNWEPVDRSPPDGAGEVRSRGSNTDAEGLIRALKEEFEFEPAGRSVMVLGAGGAGRVAALRLAAGGAAAVWLINRTRNKSEELAREIRQLYPGTTVKLEYPAGPVDLLVNATSLGLKPGDPLPFDRGSFRVELARSVYDMIYRPAETPLLAGAREAGCRAANGLGMLLHQGALALELWTGSSPPLAVMRKALTEHLYV